MPAEPGLFRLRPDLERAVEGQLPPACAGSLTTVRFMLSVEISTIYKKGDKTRKIHHLVYAPDFDSADRLVASLTRIGNLHSDGRPILGLDSRHLLEMTLESGPGSYLVPAHVWTPWFAALGSKSGFDAVDDCYGDLAPHIFAVETGLSSDPPMNWRVSSLDRFRLVSNSDAHSPEKLGREVCVFDTEMDYFAVRRALETGEGYGGTLEFFPEEGKYHLDGHRNCNVRLEPDETRRRDGRCPACGKPLTVGVMHRVEDLADRAPDATPPDTAGDTWGLIPLPEILGEIHRVGPKSKRVAQDYEGLLARLGPEAPAPQRPAAGGHRAGGATPGGRGGGTPAKTRSDPGCRLRRCIWDDSPVPGRRAGTARTRGVALRGRAGGPGPTGGVSGGSPASAAGALTRGGPADDHAMGPRDAGPIVAPGTTVARQPGPPCRPGRRSTPGRGGRRRSLAHRRRTRFGKDPDPDPPPRPPDHEPRCATGRLSGGHLHAPGGRRDAEPVADAVARGMGRGPVAHVPFPGPDHPPGALERRRTPARLPGRFRGRTAPVAAGRDGPLRAAGPCPPVGHLPRQADGHAIRGREDHAGLSERDGNAELVRLRRLGPARRGRPGVRCREPCAGAGAVSLGLHRRVPGRGRATGPARQANRAAPTATSAPSATPIRPFTASGARTGDSSRSSSTTSPPPEWCGSAATTGPSGTS